MDCSFLYTPGFVREWRRLRLTDDDLVSLEGAIVVERDVAPVIRGGGGLRKLRFAPPSWRRGKSGATRVGFAYFRTKAMVVVMAVFAKNEAPNFTTGEAAEIAKYLREMEKGLR